MPNWTEAQRKAIYEPSGKGGILVSAAAGSGKTAVLVERIVNLITRGDNPVSVDRLLVVTFTEAASTEMKERIIARLNEEYRAEVRSGNTEKSRYLRSQIHLTAAADINTIDAFCLSVVKNNFHVLGIDPDFGIMDRQESELLMDDALSDLFSELYASDEDSGRFDSLVKAYASNRDDEGLKRLVLSIFAFTRNLKEPEEWLTDKADMYSSDMTKSRWLTDIILGDKLRYTVNRNKDIWKNMLSQMRVSAEKGQGIARDEGIADMDFPGEVYWGRLWENVRMCAEAAAALESASGWNDISAFCKKYIGNKKTLGNAMNAFPKNIQAEEREWKRYYNLYNSRRNAFREDCALLVSVDMEDYNEYVHAEELKQKADDLVWIVKRFISAFSERKDKRNIKSFDDIERLAYRLFKENSGIRAEYADRYEEILIDEYQDTNGMQDAIFESISRDGKNIFMVGDLKQSIYRFRGGDPTIFKKKSAAYAKGERGGKRIQLNQNFRSRETTLNSINSLFRPLMSDEVGDVEYSAGEELRRDAGDTIFTGGARGADYRSELYRIAVTGGEDRAAAERAEAECIADRIRELVDSGFPVYDNGNYRGAEYRDIVALVRSVKISGAAMRTALESRSIPSFVQKEEYFERREIRLMLTFLSLINNHMQDIPLVSVMRSPIGGFTETELARIKIARRNDSLYKAVRGYRYNEDNLSAEDEKLREKCRRFTESLDRWRSYAKIKPIAALVWTLYEETGFYDFMGALEGGDEAQANLRLLYERARKYEKSGFKGIFNFIRYIERIGRRSEDISGANLISESHNVVRIMTIHKSKGLEFPIVFLAGTCQSAVGRASRGDSRVMLHNDIGMGIDYFNYDNMYRKRLQFTGCIADEERRENRSEEMRLMYVAMTRAKEKLIVTASRAYKDDEEYEKATAEERGIYENMPLMPNVAEDASCYADWIIPAVLSDGRYWDCHDVKASVLTHKSDEKDTEEDFIPLETDKLREGVRRILEFSYAHRGGAIPAKTSVTAIKEMADAESEREENTVYMTRQPSFMRSERLGAEIGTAHHQVMSYIDIDRMRGLEKENYQDFVAAEIERIAADGQLRPEITADRRLTERICSNVCGFFESDTGAAVLSARKVYREKPFEIEIRADEYDSDIAADPEDTIIVQGIIDLYFEDGEGNLTLVDYKTDRCSTKEEQEAVARRYAKQLELYGRAMEKILKKPVKDKYLYLFSAKSVVKLK